MMDSKEKRYYNVESLLADYRKGSIDNLVFRQELIQLNLDKEKIEQLFIKNKINKRDLEIISGILDINISIKDLEERLVTRSEKKKEHSDIIYDLIFAVGGGILLGLFEGSIYPTGGVPPRLGHFGHWLILAILLVWVQRDKHSWTFVPFSLVLQDAFSLFAQGQNPITANWYSAFFGNNILTWHTFGVPNWYLFATALSVILTIVVRTEMNIVKSIKEFNVIEGKSSV